MGASNLLIFLESRLTLLDLLRGPAFQSRHGFMWRLSMSIAASYLQGKLCTMILALRSLLQRA